MGSLVGTVQFNGFFKIFRSKLSIALALMAIASVDIGRCIARLKGQGLIEVLQCLIVLILVVSDSAKIDECPDIPRIDSKGL